MGRSFRRVYPRCDLVTAQRTIEQILMSNGYHIHNYSTGEIVWKKGTGLMTAMHYIKVEYYATEIHLYGWVQSGIGDVGLGEMDLSGFVGIIPKQAVSKVLDQIMASV
ncbi:MAG: hypothetical protein IJA71_00800 [Clostridia bacterium]|nr:hypothetical protein [Clostridia bacterium]